MHEDCVAARPIHLQPLDHAHFTAPLLHQVRAVSLFPVFCSWLMSPLLLLFWDLCAFSRAARLWGPQERHGRSHTFIFIQCATVRTQSVSVGLAQVAEGHSARDRACFGVCCNPYPVSLRAGNRKAPCGFGSVVPRPAKTPVRSETHSIILDVLRSGQQHKHTCSPAV